MNKPIINIADIELKPRPEAFRPTGKALEKFDSKMGSISAQIGAQKLGYNITVVPPGKRAFPFHNHRINEEMFFILEGTGETRIGENTYPLRSGDFIACPPGDKTKAHQIINNGTVELKYLAVSTKMTPEIVDYPDSNKFGILAEYPPDFQGKPSRFVYVGRENLNVNYWDGE
ncbi:MAG: cupin domain-containing protein [Candidatus Omnitrophica bacterium]|nr:cupin domain-containing protein [Candidatus Omnitrophota bacterium]